MPPSTLAYVTREVLRWARESIGLELEEAAELMKAPTRGSRPRSPGKANR